MARSYANIVTTIYADPEFCGLSAGAQRTYFMLVVQPEITACGSLALTLRRWAKTVPEAERHLLGAWLTELEQARYVLVDEDTEELLVRTFAKWDGGYKHAKRVLAVVATAEAIRSPRLRTAIAVELASLDVHTAIPMPSDSEPNATREATGSGRSVVTEGESSATTHTPQPATLEPAAETAPRKRGRRLPDDWRPSDAARAWTLQRLDAATAAVELEKFRNYWTAKTGRDATKLDWDATWRNWVLNGNGRASPRSPQQDTDDHFARAAARMGVTA